MMLSRTTLHQHPGAFTALCGLTVSGFAALVDEIRPAHDASALARKRRPDRRRAIGAVADRS